MTFYFGCWGRPGHHLFEPGGSFVPHTVENSVVWFADRRHIDGNLAPRRTVDGEICWRGQKGAEECPQGQYLIHFLDNGYTAMQWWDRNQGDTRSACNSTILMKGEHTEEEMLAALREHFPTVVANLEKAGIGLMKP